MEISELKIKAEGNNNDSNDYFGLIQNEFPKIFEEYNVLVNFREELLKRLGDVD